MKKQKTAKGKLLVRILTVVVLGVILLVFVGGFLNCHGTYAALQTTPSELALQTSARLQNYLSRYAAIVKEIGMYPRMDDDLTAEEKLVFCRKEPTSTASPSVAILTRTVGDTKSLAK